MHIHFSMPIQCPFDLDATFGEYAPMVRQIARVSAIFIGIILIGSYWYAASTVLPAFGVMCIGWPCGIFGNPSAIFHWNIPWPSLGQSHHHWHK